MFTCVDYNIFDPHTDEYNPYYDWFTEACDECNATIANRYYAVRIPVTGGMWRGCFCSWECVLGSILLPIDEDTEDKEAVEEYNQNQKEIIEYYAYQMEKYGIQDRIETRENQRLFGLPLSLGTLFENFVFSSKAVHFENHLKELIIPLSDEITLTGKDYPEMINEDVPQIRSYDPAIDRLCTIGDVHS